MNNSVNSILIHADDDVATALVELVPGACGRYMLQGIVHELAVRDRIPEYHKFAVRDIRRSEPVRKYGEIIGEAVDDIRSGAHVHVHNIVSPGENRK